MPENYINRYTFKSGLNIEFEILELQELYKKFKNLLIAPHRVNFYYIIWFKKKASNHIIDFKTVEIIPYDLVFLGKDTVQCFDDQDFYKGKAILFTEKFFCKSESDTSFLNSTLLFNNFFSISKLNIKENPDEFATILSAMEKELSNSFDSYQEKLLKNHLHNMMLLSERMKKQQGTSLLSNDPTLLDSLSSFKQLLEKHFKNKKQVSFYAQELLINPKKLTQITTRTLGKTPKKIIDDRIILEAKRLLVYSDNNIKEIAHELGFDESTNFIKFFKNHSSITPKDFKNTNKKNLK